MEIVDVTDDAVGDVLPNERELRARIVEALAEREAATGEQNQQFTALNTIDTASVARDRPTRNVHSTPSQLCY